MPAILLVGLFWSLRQIEHWLHRHIFKVGWLVTKSYDATTVLYYAFFLPGVFLNQFVMWLAAGMLDVQADRSLEYPKKQEIGELRLNFVQLNKKAPAFKSAIIHIVPLLVGLAAISWLESSVFNLREVLTIISDEQRGGLFGGLQVLFSRPDFWLAAYITFTIANTMMPQRGALKGFVPIVLGIGALATAIIIAGLGDEFGGALVEPLLTLINGTSLLFGMVIVVDVLATALLALIENAIELATGDSATFKNGKMIAVRRKELIAQRAAEREKERKKRDQRKQNQTALPASAGGPPSIYRFALPLPLADPSSSRVTIHEQKPLFNLEKPRPAVPTRIEAQAEVHSIDDTGEPVSKPASPKPPLFNPAQKPRNLDILDEDAEEDTQDAADEIIREDQASPFVLDEDFTDEYPEDLYDDYQDDTPAVDESDEPPPFRLD